MKASDLNKAARAHAKKQLGETQYRYNKPAVQAICADYKAGFTDGFAAGQQQVLPTAKAAKP